MSRPRKFRARLFGVLGPLALCLWLCGASEPNPVAAPPLRVRFEWSGPHAESWQGLLEVNSGEIRRPQSLGMEADGAGALWIDDGALWIHRRTPRTTDAFDVDIAAAPEALLSFTLQKASQPEHCDRAEFRFSEIFHREKTVVFAGQGNKVVIRRVPGDGLQIDLEHPHVVFAPADTLRAAIAAKLPDPTEKPVLGTLHWKLHRQHQSRAVAQGTQPLTFPSKGQPAGPRVPFELKLPREEGVYTLKFTAAGKGVGELERHVQFVVMGADALPRPKTEAAPKLIDEFEPATANYFRKLGDHQSAGKRDPALSKWLRMKMPNREGEAGVASVAAVDSSLQWSAFRLKLEHPERAHRLVVKLNPTGAQQIGISLLQPNSAGQLPPVGLDTGIVVSPETATAILTAQTDAGSGGNTWDHQLIFWPRLKDPVLLLHNVQSGLPINVAKVQVYEIGEALPRTGTVSPLGPQSRLIGPYMNKPLLPENFGGPDVYDAPGDRSLDDWETFYVSARRLVDYLQHAGHNSLMISVFCDGSTIYPSELLDPSPRFDTGVFSSTGQDPIRKDVVELLLRFFARENLALIPELQFSTPLPELERLLAMPAAGTEGIQLIGADGKPWTEGRTAARGQAPYYNPLHPLVQTAILNVVDEFVQRYRHHTSLRGIAFELGVLGYLQFPDANWGYDDETLRQFETDTGIKVPEPAGVDRFAARHEFLSTRGRQVWLRWRTQAIARFHQRLVRSVTGVLPNAQVFLTGHRMIWDGEQGESLSQMVRNGSSLEQHLTAQGLDLSQYADERQLNVLRPIVHGHVDQLFGGGFFDTLNHAPSTDAAFRGVTRGALLFNVASEHRIAGFDAVSPWQPARTWLVTHAVSHGFETRRRYSRMLATVDCHVLFDGGWMTPLGNDDETRDLRVALLDLPAVRFQTVSGLPTQPAVVRTANWEGNTYLIAVNDSPFATQLELQLSCPAATRCLQLGKDRKRILLQRHPAQEGQSRLTIRLAPHDVWCGRLENHLAEIRGALSNISEKDVTRIQERIVRFNEHLTAVDQRSKIGGTPLANPGFELAGGEQDPLPGWQAPGSEVDWSVDTDNPHSGRSALQLASGAASAALMSPELPLSGTRFLTVSLWLRSEQAASPVRIALEAEVAGKLTSQEARIVAGTEWARFQFRINQLPERIVHPQLKIESLGGGKLWIDDVDVQAQRLTTDDLRQLMKTQSALKLAWEEKRYADCQRLLENYWTRLVVPQETNGTAPVSGVNTQRSAKPKGLFRR